MEDWKVDGDIIYLALDDYHYDFNDPVKTLGKYSLLTGKPFWAYNFYTDDYEDNYDYT